MSYLICANGKWRLDERFTGEFWKNENGEIFFVCSCGAEGLKNDFCEHAEFVYKKFLLHNFPIPFVEVVEQNRIKPTLRTI